MSRKRSFSLLAIVLIGGLFSAGVAFAAMSGEEIELRKKAVIRESLEKLGRPTENAALLEAAQQAQALLEIKVERGVRETCVSILTTDEPAYESFPLRERERVVIDLYNTINFHSGDTYKSSPPSVVKTIRTSLFQLEPQFVSRIVVDLEKMVEIQVSQQGPKIEVTIPEDVEVPAAAPAVPEKPAELAELRKEPEVERAPRAEEELDVAKREEALAAAERKIKQLEQAEAKATGAARAPTDAEIRALREQLDYQKEAYAKLKASFDADVDKRTSELEQKLRADLGKKEQESKEALKAQRSVLAELEQRLAAEVSEKEQLAKKLAETKKAAVSGAGQERERERVRTAAVPDLTEQTVSLNIRDEDLGGVLDLLSRKANINLMAGKEVAGKVTARLVDVPLMKAMELVLRENGYGLVHEEGIYRVIPLELAEQMGVTTTTETFKLEYAKASDVAATLKDVLTAKGGVVANDSANVVVVTDVPVNLPRIADVIEEIDVAQTIVDTVTGTFRLSYLDAVPSSKMLEKMVTEHGSIIADQSTNTVILTDTPANFQVVSDLIEELDQRPDQVYIEVLMVDAVLSDDSEFGVDWLARALREHHGGNLSQLDFDTTLGNVGTQALNAGVLTLGILSGDFSLDAIIAAEVQSRDATILADPKILVVNNETAKIEIVTEVPFQEITQSTQGPPVASTEFKDIGTTLDVTPRITHENTIILRIRPEESSISGYTDDGVPIEDSRRADTSILLNDGQTVVVGGLRNIASSTTVTRVPWLGDIPFLGRLFRNTVTRQSNTELLVFLTVHIVKGVPPELTPYERSRFTEIETAPKVPDATRELWEEMKRPWGKRTPFWRRRTRER